MSPACIAGLHPLHATLKTKANVALTKGHRPAFADKQGFNASHFARAQQRAVLSSPPTGVVVEQT